MRELYEFSRVQFHVIPLLSAILMLQVGGGQIVNDDRDVIQCALLSFFQSEEWHSADWHPKNHVVLRPQLTSKTRDQFGEEIERLSKSQRTEIDQENLVLHTDKTLTAEQRKRVEVSLKQARATLDTLKKVLAELTGPVTYKSADLIPLKSMAWDPRIIVTDKSNRYAMRRDTGRDPALEADTIYARTSRPCFSRDGIYAFVTFEIPWSMHGSQTTFLLKRVLDGWKIVVAVPTFFV